MAKSEVLSREDTVTEAGDEEILDGPEALLIAAEEACVGGVCTLPATQRLQIRVTIALAFYRSQNVLSRSKCFELAQNLTAFSASSKTFVPAQKPILLNANHLLVWQKMFVTGTICK